VPRTNKSTPQSRRLPPRAAKQTASPATRRLPARSARQTTSYAPNTGSAKKPKSSGSRVLILSDASSTHRKAQAAEKTATARSQIRQQIADHTKPKRNAFFLAKKDMFLPLLPRTNYISKLEREHGASGELIEIVPSDDTLEQPKGITATMKPYQKEGLTFLVHMYHNGMSAILGDEMGLGKTLQTLSLFQHLKVSEPTSSGETRPFLVICPLSVLSSWATEAAKWTPEFKVIRFHGPKAERERLKQETMGFIDRYGAKTTNSRAKTNKKQAEVIDLTEEAQPVDLVITTYETFVTEQSWFKRAFAWRYVVTDEGHKLKNNKSNVSSALQTIRAEHRLLLTGTPLQNNLQELWALLHWLFPEVFTDDTSENFSRAFDLSKGQASTSFMDDARRLLEIIMLRRMKNSPGVNLGLPPKEEVLLFVPLTPMQKFWYTRLLTKADNLLLEDLFRGVKSKTEHDVKKEQTRDSKLSLLEQTAHGSDGTDVWAESKEIMSNVLTSGDKQSNEYQKLMMLVLQLRKACTHPYLLPGSRPEPYYIGNHVRIASGKFIVLEKILQELVVKQRKKILIFSGWTKTLNMIEDLLELMGTTGDRGTLRHLRFDGSTGRARRNLTIRMFNDQASEFNIMLISTRAGGLGINLTSATDVIFMDEDWNPQVTLQAEARSHRIGQTKKVTIYKLCTQGTVEEQMMGRIRKKLYLSAKITESMRNMHTVEQHQKKRKRGGNDQNEDDTPQLDTSELKTLLRRGAQTLSTPEIDIDEMLTWDWQTTLDKCRDRPQDPLVAASANEMKPEVDEEAWLNNVEKVETAIFDGKRHHRQLEKDAKDAKNGGILSRADRRVGKNTTVMVGGFAISKESLGCADWEAVPTLAGKDPRLAEPKREKKEPIQNQEHCQVCWDGGSLVLCSGCPRSYHSDCLDKSMPAKSKSATGSLYCSQHQCFDCEKKTGEAGGLIFRCRWCEKGYCEDCMDWDTVKLVGESIPEMEMLNYYTNNGWYVECQTCVEHWQEDPEDHKFVQKQKRQIEKQYDAFLKESDAVAEASAGVNGKDTCTGTPVTISEAETPTEEAMPMSKKQKTGLPGFAIDLTLD
jgi:SWI/SNF-related matrix-associated actin-dependent regulator of chromatin subfamily A member 5